MWGYGTNWGMMGGWGGGTGWMGFGMVFVWLLLIAALIALVVWLVRSPPHAGANSVLPPRRSPGLDILEERYARGEINRDEYLQKKRDMGA